MRVEKIIDEPPCEGHGIPVCVAGQEPGPPGGCGAPRVYASGVAMRSAGTCQPTSMRSFRRPPPCTPMAVTPSLADPETFADFKQAVSRLRSREPSLVEAFPHDAHQRRIVAGVHHGCWVLHDQECDTGCLH